MRTFISFGRAAWLALILLLITLPAAFAHSLPGSVLTFSQNEDRLTLEITLPLEDLLIAAPELSALAIAPNEAHVSEEVLAALSKYFAEHLSVQKSSKNLKLSLLRASIDIAFDEHVGEFELLLLNFDLEHHDTDPFLPVTLIYDAVMHEVRNHRAKVFFEGRHTEPLGLAEFGLRPVNGTQSPVLLRRP